VLAIVGVATVFGESLLAMFAPPRSELATGNPTANLPRGAPSPSTRGTTAPAPFPPVPPDGGLDTTPARNPSDGNS
jgi:hypothetical protein